MGALHKHVLSGHAEMAAASNHVYSKDRFAEMVDPSLFDRSRCDLEVVGHSI